MPAYEAYVPGLYSTGPQRRVGREDATPLPVPAPTSLPVTPVSVSLPVSVPVPVLKVTVDIDRFPIVSEYM